MTRITFQTDDWDTDEDLRKVDWPSVPRIGEFVNVDGGPDGLQGRVTDVFWHPGGEAWVRLSDQETER